MSKLFYYVSKLTKITNQLGQVIDQDYLGLYFKDEKTARDNIKKDIEALENSKYLANCTHTPLSEIGVTLQANLSGEQHLIFIADYQLTSVAELLSDVDVFPDTEELLKKGTYKDQTAEDLKPFGKQAERDKMDELADLSKQLIQISSAEYYQP